MSKFLYPIYKLNIESYKKWWLYHKKAGGSGVLSEILEGFSFNLANTLNRKFKLFEIEGNSVQETTTGKNKVDVTSGTINIPSTFTLTQNADGTLTLNGNTDGDVYYAILNMKFANIVNGNSYKLVTKVKSGTWNAGVIGMQFIDSNAQQIQTLQNSSSSQESKAINGNVNEVNLYFYGSATNLVIEIMLVEASITDDTYEKFTYGASPNPNYEQPIKSAGENGSINEKITNADGTEEQDYSIYTQQPMRSIGDVRDCFVKKDGSWYERHMPYIASYNGETLPQDVYNEVDNVKYCNEKSMSTTGQFSIGASVQYIDENNWNDLPCTPEQIEALENLPSTYKEMTIIQSQDETPAHLKIQYWKEVQP